MKYIEVCHLEGSENKEEELILWFLSSKNKIKKYFLKKDLIKKISPREVLKIPLNFINDGMIYPKFKGESLPKILFQDENFIALFKPHKIHMHPLSYDEGDNLLSFLREKFGDALLFVNQNHYDRGLLYRLDYETSGIALYVKKETVYLKLREKFKHLAKEKIYYAVVSGNFNHEGEVSHYLKASGEKGSFIKEDESGTLCKLYVCKKEFNAKNNLSLLEVHLVNGFRHQIRAELSLMGFPILGDELYGGENSDRLYLHAHLYKIIWDENEFEFKSDLPSLFLNLFNFN